MQRAALSPDHGSEASLMPKAAAFRNSYCSLRDSLETKENSAVKFPALSKRVVSPLARRRLDFDGYGEEPVSSPIKPVRRSRTSAYAHQEKRFKGSERVVSQVLLELFDAKTGEGQFFKCYQDQAIGAEGILDLPQGQEDDCDTDEETAETMQRSLAEVLEEAIQNSRSGSNSL